LPQANLVDLISSAADQTGVPRRLALRVAKLESNLNPAARSSAGAAGLFQLLPAAIADVVQRTGKRVAGSVTDPATNAWIGCQYLRICATYVGRSVDDQAAWPLIYAAYNIGAGNVRKLQRGDVDVAVRRAVAAQATIFSRGGPLQYLANVETAILAVG